VLNQRPPLDSEIKLGSQAASPEQAGETYLFPCSQVQRVCWFLEQMSPGTAANNIAVRFLLQGPLRPDLLLASLREIVRRHEILRTRFVERDNDPKQLVEKDAQFELPLDDLRRLPAELRVSEQERLAAEEARIPFDVARGPLFRGRLLRTAKEEYVLLLTMHHIVSDGWSVGIVTDELGGIYEALLVGNEPALPELPIQYADYACWQDEWVASGELERKLEYWKTKLDGFPPLQIPTDKPRPAKPAGQGEIRSIVLPRKLTDALKQLSDRQGCTLFVTMLAAFVTLMRHESGQNDVVLRTQTAGRGQVELERLIGWFVNSIVLRTDVSQDPTFLGLLERVRETVLSAFDHQDAPFERLMQVVRPARTSTRQLPFQVNFIFQRDFVKPWQRGGIAMTPIPSKAAGTFVDLNFFLVERGDGWRASVDVDTEVFLPETGDLFLKNFKTVLETAAQNPDLRISRMALQNRPTIELVERDVERALSDYAAPRNEIEAGVAAIWEKALGIAPIGVLTNFFDLGGHSLLAVQILAAIHRQFGRQIKLAELFVDPTVAAMARILDPSVSWKQDIDLIRVQPNGTRPPLFMVGGDHWFRPLSKRLGGDQPLLGLSLQRYEGRSEPTPLEEIAADLTDGILKLQPAGPYFLSGWCVDGVVAFEVARQLMDRGHAVGLVALIDAMNPDYRREFQSRSAGLQREFQRMRLLAHEIASRKIGSERPAHLWRGLRGTAARFARNLFRRDTEIARDPIIVKADSDRQEFRRMLYISESNYKTPVLSCPVLLLRTKVTVFQEPNLGWERVASSLETVEVPGDHIGMFREPQVAHLGAELGSRLEKAQKRSAEAPLAKPAGTADANFRGARGVDGGFGAGNLVNDR
jgi:thioesterase domain-containing protein